MIDGVQKRSIKVKNLAVKMKMRKNWKIDQIFSFIDKYIVTNQMNVSIKAQNINQKSKNRVKRVRNSKGVIL